jgi:hypothetical protein
MAIVTRRQVEHLKLSTTCKLLHRAPSCAGCLARVHLVEERKYKGIRDGNISLAYARRIATKDIFASSIDEDS